MSDGPPGGTPPPPPGQPPPEPPGWVPPPGHPPPAPPPPAPPPPGQPGWGQPPPSGQPPPGQAGWGQPPPGQAPPGQPAWGQPPPPPYYGQYQAPRKTDGTAVAVLVLGISSLVLLFTCLVGWIPAIVALCLAPGARRRIQQSGGMLDGENFVRIGTILSWISIGLAIAGVVLVIILAIAGAFDEDNSTTFDSLGLLVQQLPVR